MGKRVKRQGKGGKRVRKSESGRSVKEMGRDRKRGGEK